MFHSSSIDLLWHSSKCVFTTNNGSPDFRALVWQGFKAHVLGVVKIDRYFYSTFWDTMLSETRCSWITGRHSIALCGALLAHQVQRILRPCRNTGAPRVRNEKRHRTVRFRAVPLRKKRWIAISGRVTLPLVAQQASAAVTAKSRYPASCMPSHSSCVLLFNLNDDGRRVRLALLDRYPVFLPPHDPRRDIRRVHAHDDIELDEANAGL